MSVEPKTVAQLPVKDQIHQKLAELAELIVDIWARKGDGQEKGTQRTQIIKFFSSFSSSSVFLYLATCV